MNHPFGKLGASLALALGLGCASSAHALFIDGTDVGMVDKLLCAKDSDKSGQGYEEAFVKACTGQSVSLADNIDITNSGLLTQGGLNAIDISPNAPGFFLLKFGVGNTGNDMLVFENLMNLSFLVWTDDQLLSAGVPSRHLDSISHYTFGGGATSVPEPATVTLLGVGLAALGLTRRRRVTVAS